MLLYEMGCGAVGQGGWNKSKLQVSVFLTQVAWKISFIPDEPLGFYSTHASGRLVLSMLLLAKIQLCISCCRAVEYSKQKGEEGETEFV